MTKKSNEEVNIVIEEGVDIIHLQNYLYHELKMIANLYLFEYNDPYTRNSAKGKAEGFLDTLVKSRVITDYTVICDSNNNTPERIDNCEFWMDCAIRAEKSTDEIIHVPVGILISSTQPISL